MMLSLSTTNYVMQIFQRKREANFLGQVICKIYKDGQTYHTFLAVKLTATIVTTRTERICCCKSVLQENVFLYRPFNK